MAVFAHIVWNERTGRHELDVVNQQFDRLFGVRWDEGAGDYTLDVGEEEARPLLGDAARPDLEPTALVAHARCALPERDRRAATAPEP
ncbi:MAG: hypothetical protein OHK0013_37200 [Sandaracinaceae bacterium]